MAKFIVFKAFQKIKKTESIIALFKINGLENRCAEKYS
jgi:hypothetical protein